LIASCSFCTMIHTAFSPPSRCRFFLSLALTSFPSFSLLPRLSGGILFFSSGENSPKRVTAIFQTLLLIFLSFFRCYHLLSAEGALLLYRSLPRRRNFHGLPFPAGPGSAFYRAGGGGGFLLLCANFPSLSGCAVSTSSRPLMLGVWCLVLSALTLSP